MNNNDNKISFLEEGQFFSRNLKKIARLSESAKQALLDEQKHIINAIKKVNQLLEEGKFEEAYNIASKFEKNAELKLLAYKAKVGIEQKVISIIEVSKQDDIKIFPSVEIMMIKFNDYLIEDGSFKVIQNYPLHIQLSPKIYS